MAGELWNQVWEIGNETTAGTPVARSRKMYFDKESFLKRSHDARPHKFATGTRDNTRNLTLGPQMVDGTVSFPLSSGEIIEPLLMTLDGTVTPTGATAKLWAFEPGNTLDFASIGWHDGARPWLASGVYGSKLKISGNVKEATTVSMDVVGLTMTQTALTGGFSDRVPSIIEGWETKLYIDSFGGTPGTTAVSGTLINWDIEIDNQLKRKFYAGNTNATSAIVTDELVVTAKLLFEASSATSLTEFNNWVAVTKRLVRVEFGQNVVISGADKEFVTVDIPGAWDAVDLGQTDENTRAYELSLQYVYDVTNSFGLQVRAQNNRSTGY
jgi:hypothetical protein